jgi:outer membrane protein insertion porin family
MIAIKTLAKKIAMTLILSSSVGAFSAYADKVAAIKIQGNKRIESETILSYIPFKTGSEFDSTAMDQALKDLFATGYFTDVKVIREGDTLVIDVMENPIINRIAFEGNSKLKDDKLTEEIQLRPREVLSRTRIQTAQQRILDLYRRMGRYNATVEPKVIRQEENRVDLVFEINEGDVTYVRKINFIGNKNFSSSKLESALLTKSYKFYRFFAYDDTYDSDRFNADQQLLRQFYYDHGFPDFRLISANAELSQDHKDFYLTFTIDEGEKYTFGKINIQSSIQQINPDDFKDEILSKTGNTFSSKQIEKTIEKLTERIGEKGYAFAEIQPKIDKNRDTKTVDVTFEIKEGPRVYIERIDIVGNDRTKDHVIRREISIHEGDAYHASNLKKAEKNIKDLGYFKKVEVLTESGSSPDKARVIVKVEEQPTGEFGVAGGFSTVDGILGNVKFSEKNFMGTGRIIHTDFTIAKKRQDFDIGITDPYFLGYNLVAGVDLFRVRSTRFSAFTQLTNGFSNHIGYNLTENWSQTLTYTLKQDKVSHIDPRSSIFIQQQKGSFTTSSIGQALTYDKRDSKIDPTSGYVFSIGNTFAGLGGQVKYLRNTIGASFFYSPLEDVVINVRGSIGNIVKIQNKMIRIVDSIMLGADSFRGFEYGGLGPRDAGTLDSLGGTRYWTGTVEAVFPIGLPNEFGVKGAVFTDFGTVWKTGQAAVAGNVLDRRALRLSAGFGLSWISPFGPLRVDYAFPIKRERYDKTQRILFGFSTRY